MIKNFILLVFVVISCLGCQKIDPSKIPPPYKVSFYSEGREIKTITIPTGSELEQKIILFFENNQTGWDPSLVTYAPGLMIYGENFKLLLDDMGPVLNYWPEENSFQGTKSSSTEFRALKQRVHVFLKENS